MARIYRTTDRIKVKIDDLVVTISPLSYHQKAQIQTHLLGFTNGDVKEATQAMVSAIKYSVKDIEGVEDENGNKYELEFEDGVLSDACVSDLLNLETTDKLSMICSSLLHGVPTNFTDAKGNPLEGVELVKKGDSPNS